MKQIEWDNFIREARERNRRDTQLRWQQWLDEREKWKDSLDKIQTNKTNPDRPENDHHPEDDKQNGNN